MKVFATMLFFCLFTSSVPATLFYNLDQASQLSNDWTQINAAGTSVPASYSSSAGFGGGAGVRFNQFAGPGASSYVNNNSFDGAISNFEMSFIWRNAASSASIRMGVTDSNAYTLSIGGIPTFGAGPEIGFIAFLGTAGISLTQYDGVSGTTIASQALSGLTTDTFYFSRLNIQYDPMAMDYDLSLTLSNVDGSGNEGSEIQTITASNRSSDLRLDSEAYAYFSGIQNMNGAVDNISLIGIPEPHSVFLLLLGSVMVLALKRFRVERNAAG